MDNLILLGYKIQASFVIYEERGKGSVSETGPVVFEMTRAVPMTRACMPDQHLGGGGGSPYEEAARRITSRAGHSEVKGPQQGSQI